jgi:glutamate/tyrosine decarboxylase-like PLP-dependent enzyme
MDWNPEWSRRARGFPTYAALRSLGRRGVAELFETYCEHTRTLAKGLAGLPGAELLYEPIVNQALVRFHDLRERAGEAEHDLRTDAVIAGINATGEAFFTGTTWRGRRVMRISVCNWRTDADDVQRTLNAASRVVFAQAADGRSA